MTDQPSTAAELAELAAQIHRLRPDWNRMDGYYEARSEIAASLHRIARLLGHRADVPQPLRLHIAPPARRATPYAPPVSSPRLPPPAAPTPAPVPAQRRPRVGPLRRRHRYPRPPALPPTVQPQLL
jgi:hypothetical protein